MVSITNRMPAPLKEQIQTQGNLEAQSDDPIIPMDSDFKPDDELDKSMVIDMNRVLRTRQRSGFRDLIWNCLFCAILAPR